MPGKRKREDDSATGDSEPKRQKSGEGVSKGKVALDREGQKKLKNERKASRKYADVVEQLKQLWETGRQKQIDAAKRTEIVDRMAGLVQSKVKEIAFKHDASRIVQFLIKFGTEEQRASVFEELSGCTVELIRNHYGRFIIIKMMKYGGKKQRDKVMTDLRGNIVKLAVHREAADVLETIYGTYANSGQKNRMVLELYGPEWRLFKSEEEPTLEDILKNAPSKKASVQQNLNKVVHMMIDKGVIRYSLPHRALLDYLTICDENGRTEVIQSLREALPEIVHTREGAQAAIICISHGTAKDRKVMVKSFKSYIKNLCVADYGRLVLMRLFDVMDDTQLIAKIIFPELFKDLEEIVLDKNGALVLLHLLVPRSKHHFADWQISLLPPSDMEGTCSNSKKDVDVRAEELRSACAAKLLELCALKPYELLASFSGSAVLLESLRTLEGSKKDALEAIVALVDEEDMDVNILNHRIGNRVISKLIKESGSLDSEVAFDQLLLEKMSGSLLKWAVCWASTVVLALLKNETTKKKVTAELKKHAKKLGTSESEGAQLVGQQLLAK